MEVVIHPFVKKRQTSKSPHSHPTVSWDEIKEATLANLDNMKPGYRPGVYTVEIPASMAKSAIIKLEPGMELSGTFMPRKEGEEPRISTFVNSAKSDAGHVTVVLYSSKVLKETNENSAEDAWEVISLNALPVGYTKEIPIENHTLMHNHFGSDGGSDTKMSDKEFVAALKSSFNAWKTLAHVSPLSRDRVAHMKP